MKSIRTLYQLGLSLLATIPLGSSAFAQPNSLPINLADGSHVKWTLTTDVATPESAYFDPQSKLLFVSNVAGSPGDKDGNGWISAVSFDKAGKPQTRKLVDGLNAPKGLRARNGVLWVTDIDTLLSIDIKTGSVLSRLPVEGALFLNDIGIDATGKVYASDMIGSKIYVVENGSVSVFFEGEEAECPNGLLVSDGKLFVAAWGKGIDPATFSTTVPGHLYALDLKTKQKTFVTAEPIGHLDGIERTKNGNFIVSDWVAGTILQVDSRGNTTTLYTGLTNSADIGLFGNNILIPNMGSNQIIAVSLSTR